MKIGFYKYRLLGLAASSCDRELIRMKIDQKKFKKCLFWKVTTAFRKKLIRAS